METAIRTENLTKAYKQKVAVDGLDLTVFKGEVFALLGPNGAGKTTTIKMLCGLISPSGGEAYVAGKSITKEIDEVKRLIGVSPQETAVAKNLTAYENLRMIADVSGKSIADVDEIYNRFRLDTQDKILAKKMSGGWQRVLSIAMAVILDPEVYFLDEPTLGLDVEARRDVWEVIKGLKTDKTVVLTTHYLEEAYSLADRIGIIKDGKLIELGSGAELEAKYTKEGEKLSFDDVYLRIVRGE